MNGRFLGYMTAFGLAVVGGAGCCHSCHRPYAYNDTPTPWCPSCQPGASGPVAVPPDPRPLPGAVPTPPGAVIAPPQPGLPTLPPQTRGYEPFPPAPQQPTWRPPAAGGARLAPPEPVVSETPPQSPEPPRAAPPSRAGVSEQPGSSPALPVGIPQFAQARAGVASGLKPLLDGLEWLRTNGYRTVLHVRLPGEDDTAERRQIEKVGLKYLSLEVSPQSLSPQVVERFNQIVTGPANQPLFVYDRDGTLAGGLWYLHFRTVNQDSDEAAHLKAARLGLKEDAAGEQREMWLAIQKYLAQQAR